MASTTSRWVTALGTAGLTLFAAGEVAAQVCIGFPTASGQAAIAATVSFPEGGDNFGVEGNYNLRNNFSLFGGVNLATPDVGDNVTSVGGGAAFDVPAVREWFGPEAFSVPRRRSDMANRGGEDDDGFLSVPVGLGIGRILALGETMTLSPYVVPQIRWTFIGDSNESDFEITGGAILHGLLGERFYAGATIDRIFTEGASSVLGIKLGMTFGP